MRSENLTQGKCLDFRGRRRWISPITRWNGPGRLTVRCFAHDIMNYRYHWHPDEYELNILLHGSQEYCRGTQNVLLEEDDVLLTPPGVGHASFGQQANTTAIVLHFSAAAIRPFFKKSGVYHFPTCLSDEGTRTEERYRQIRFYASQIFTLMQQNSLYAQLAVRASLSCCWWCCVPNLNRSG